LNDEAEFSGRDADLLDGGVGDAGAGEIVDQQQLPFERGKFRGPLSQNRIEQRPNPEYVEIIALQHQIGNCPSMTFTWMRPALTSCGGTIARLK